MERRKKKGLQEAFSYVSLFESKYGRVPNIHEMDPFYWLFMERDLDKIRECGISMKLGGDEEQEVEEAFLCSKPLFDGYEAFLAEWRKNK